MTRKRNNIQDSVEKQIKSHETKNLKSVNEKRNKGVIEKRKGQKLKIQQRFEEKEIVSIKEEDFNRLLKSSLDNYEQLSESEKEFLRKNIERNRNKAQYSEEKAKLMFEQIEKRSKKQLKVISTVVPEGILPPGYSCTLYDVRIQSSGLGEFIYNKNEWIRENITRGLNFMQLKEKDGGEKFDFAIYANKKFMGGVGDEEGNFLPENKDMWKNFFVDSVTKANAVIIMKKLDGCAGHFAIRKIGGEYFIIAGSKNVHMLIRSSDDIKKYEKFEFRIAKKVAEGVLNAFDDMDKSKLLLLKHHLTITKETVVCELLDPEIKQHLIDSSHLKKATIFGLMITSPPGKEKVKSLTSIPPQIFLKYLDFLGISTPEHFSISTKRVENSITKIRRETDYEGCVLYYLIKDRTIGLLKVKTIWYIIMRGLQEKDIFCTSEDGILKKPLPDMIEASKDLIENFHELLKFSEDYSNAWKKSVEAFINWLNEKMKIKKIPVVNIRENFRATWKEFAKEKGDIFIDNNLIYHIMNNKTTTSMFRL